MRECSAHAIHILYVTASATVTTCNWPSSSWNLVNEVPWEAPNVDTAHTIGAMSGHHSELSLSHTISTITFDEMSGMQVMMVCIACDSTMATNWYFIVELHPWSGCLQILVYLADHVYSVVPLAYCCTCIGLHCLATLQIVVGVQ